jgi:hypothetical protein
VSASTRLGAIGKRDWNFVAWFTHGVGFIGLKRLDKLALGGRDIHSLAN